jgi:hypothetical protein
LAFSRCRSFTASTTSTSTSTSTTTVTCENRDLCQFMVMVYKVDDFVANAVGLTVSLVSPM